MIIDHRNDDIRLRESRCRQVKVTKCHPFRHYRNHRVVEYGPIAEIKSAHSSERRFPFHCAACRQGRQRCYVLRKGGGPPPRRRGHFTKCADVTPVSNLYFPRRLRCDCDIDVNAGCSIVPRGSICRNRTYAPRARQSFPR